MENLRAFLVAFAGNHLDLHLAAKGAVAPLDFQAVALRRNSAVLVAGDVE
jgi:hypothetical protein